MAGLWLAVGFRQPTVDVALLAWSVSSQALMCWAPTQVWSDLTARIGQNVVQSSGPGRKRTMPSRKGWVTGLPEELWVCAAAEVARRRPAAAPERARYMVSQASSRRTAPQA